MSDMFDSDEFWSDDRNESDATELGMERREASLSAIYHAAMLGLPDDELATLCFECGIRRSDLEQYVQPILRTTYKESQSTLDLQAPF